MDRQLGYRVVNIETSEPQSQQSIHKILSRCGRIRLIRPHNIQQGERHYFVEFLEQQAVDKACTLNTRDFRVLPLTKDPDLLKKYNSMVTRSFPTKHSACTSDRLSMVTRYSNGAREPPDWLRRTGRHVRDSTIQRRPVRAQVKSPNASELGKKNCEPISKVTALPLSPALTPSLPLLSPLKSACLPVSRRSPQDGDNVKELVNTSPSTSPLPIPSSLPQNNIIHVALPTPVSPPRPLPEVSGALFSLDTRIAISFCGAVITYDLDALDDDPQVIMELLKATSTERANWMQVGCHYRRKGNLNAAINVISTMLEVMKGHGIVESDLKPAFLMLSSCETGLANRTSKTDPKASQTHHDKSRSWLQKVYGESKTQPVSPTQNVLGLDLSEASPSPTKAASPGSSSPKTLPDRPRSDRVRTTSPPSSAVNPHESPASSKVRNLEREIESLRERQALQSSRLSDARSAKRKLEDDLASERAVRRKLERTLDDVEKQLKVTKRMEGFALQQVKLEVETRRKAESREEAEREKRKEIEKTLEARTDQPLFEDLAQLLQRAAKANGMALPSLNVGSVTSGNGS